MVKVEGTRNGRTETFMARDKAHANRLVERLTKVHPNGGWTIKR